MSADVIARVKTFRERLDRAADAGDREALTRLLDDLTPADTGDPIDRMLHLLRGRGHYVLATLRNTAEPSERKQALRDIKAAIADLERVVKQDPADADGHGYLGAALGVRIGLEGRLAGALYGQRSMSELEKALVLNPRSLIGHFGMGLARLRTAPRYGGNVVEAARHFDTCLQLRPEWPWPLVFLLEAYETLADRTRDRVQQHEPLVQWQQRKQAS